MCNLVPSPDKLKAEEQRDAESKKKTFKIT